MLHLQRISTSWEAKSISQEKPYSGGPNYATVGVLLDYDTKDIICHTMELPIFGNDYSTYSKIAPKKALDDHLRKITQGIEAPVKGALLPGVHPICFFDGSQNYTNLGSNGSTVVGVATTTLLKYVQMSSDGKSAKNFILNGAGSRTFPTTDGAIDIHNIITEDYAKRAMSLCTSKAGGIIQLSDCRILKENGETLEGPVNLFMPMELFLVALRRTSFAREMNRVIFKCQASPAIVPLGSGRINWNEQLQCVEGELNLSAREIIRECELQSFLQTYYQWGGALAESISNDLVEDGKLDKRYAYKMSLSDSLAAAGAARNYDLLDRKDVARAERFVRNFKNPVVFNDFVQNNSGLVNQFTADRARAYFHGGNLPYWSHACIICGKLTDKDGNDVMNESQLDGATWSSYGLYYDSQNKRNAVNHQHPDLERVNKKIASYFRPWQQDPSQPGYTPYPPVNVMMITNPSSRFDAALDVEVTDLLNRAANGEVDYTDANGAKLQGYGFIHPSQADYIKSSVISRYISPDYE